jgi:GR25 family glycosyltransferase involved in LPS biosynthesis
LERVGVADISIRFPAVDGSKLTQEELNNSTTNVCNMFCTRSLIGCAMSHISVWKKAYEAGNNTILVLEDDAEFKINNVPQFLEENDHLIPKDFDIIYLGCFGGCSMTSSSMSSKLIPLLLGKGYDPDRRVEEINQLILKPFYPLGAHGYILSRKGCEKLLKLIDSGIYNHVDVTIANDVYDNNNIIAYALRDHIVFQEGSLLETDNADYLFPSVINQILDHIKMSDGQRLGYFFNVASYQIPVVNIPINFYVLFFLLIGINLVVIPRQYHNRAIRLLVIFAVVDILLSKKKGKSLLMALFLLGIMLIPCILFCKT